MSQIIKTDENSKAISGKFALGNVVADKPKYTEPTSLREANTNELHYEELKKKFGALSEKEADICCTIMAQKYPDILINAYVNEHAKMLEVLKAYSDLAKDFRS